ncbi:MAG: DUF4834 family protein [Chitinophagaceae bacterium]
MTLLRFILYALGIYMVYKVIFDLIIPVSRATKKVRQQFGDMQQHMQDQMNATQNGYPNHTPSQPPPPEQKKTRTGDYIDFEEVKS